MGLIENLEAIKSEKDTKVLPENIKLGVNILGVSGEYTGSDIVPIKQFETIEEMQADEAPIEGGSAIVYKPTLSDWKTANLLKNGDTLYFKPIVTLTEAITSDTSLTITGTTYRYSCALTSESFTITKTNIKNTTDKVTIAEYTSADGLTYTRTSEQEYEVFYLTLSTRISNSKIIPFFAVAAGEFSGVYEYGTKPDPDIMQGYVNPDYTNNKFTYTELSSIRIVELVNYLRQNTYEYIKGCYGVLVITEDDKTFDVYNHTVASSNPSSTAKSPCGIIAHDGIRYVTTYINQGVACDKFYKIHVDLETNTHTVTEIEPTIYDYMKVCDTFSATAKIGMYSLVPTYLAYFYIYGTNSGTTANNNRFYRCSSSNMLVTKYWQKPNQFTVSSPGHLLEGKTAYGTDGIVTGDGSIWGQLTKASKMKGLFGEDNITSTDSDGVNRLYVNNLDSHIASVAPYPHNLVDSLCMPIKLRPYTNDDDNHILLTKKAISYTYNENCSRIIEQSNELNKIYIKNANTGEIIYEYDGYVGGIDISTLEPTDDINHVVGLYNDTFLCWGYDKTSMYVHKFHTMSDDFKTLTLTPGGEMNDYGAFNMFAYDPDTHKAYVAIKLDTTLDSVCKYEIGYIDIDTMTYHTMMSKNIDYYSTAYSLNACMTTNKDIFVTWFIYGINNTPGQLRWVYLLDKNGNVLSSIEGQNLTTSTYSPTLNYKESTFTRPVLYDDGTYLYSATNKIDKSTLMYTEVDTDYIVSVSTDFTYGTRSNHVYSLPEYEKIAEVQEHDGDGIYLPNGNCVIGYGIVKVGDEYINHGQNNGAILEGSYNWDMSDMSDYDILLVGPAYVSNTMAYGQYLYTINKDFNQPEGSGPLTQEEYDTAVDTASEILGEEV